VAQHIDASKAAGAAGRVFFDPLFDLIDTHCEVGMEGCTETRVGRCFEGKTRTTPEGAIVFTEEPSEDQSRSDPTDWIHTCASCAARGYESCEPRADWRAVQL
jgi:hypothetical protein